MDAVSLAVHLRYETVVLPTCRLSARAQMLNANLAAAEAVVLEDLGANTLEIRA